MSYDGLNRLRHVLASAIGTGELRYDNRGNILHYRMGERDLDYRYNGQGQLENVSGSRTYDFRYDARGNVTDNGTHNFTYNLGQQMVASGGRTYTYDGHNKRVKTQDSHGTAISVYASNGKLVYRNTDGIATEYLYLGERLIAKRKDRPNATPNLTYVHSNYLGSPVAESDATGAVLRRMHCKPPLK